MRITPVILCGGSGTRLWPLSRKDFAKQHVSILGGHPPFQRTLERIAAVDCFGQPLVISGVRGRFMAAEQAAQIGVDIDLVLETDARDTLPAIAAGAEIVRRRDPAAVMLVLPSDHLIPDPAAFATAARLAAKAADAGHMVTFGLTPRGPATAYGYIRPGVALETDAIRRIATFEEKPNALRAQALLDEGCLWNSGMFCFRADTACAEIERLAPAVAEAVSAAVDEGEQDLGALVLGPSFGKAPKISFDYGIMEKTDSAVVIEATFAWSDIGDWREVWQHTDKDEGHNAVEGEALLIDAQGNYVRADGRLVCAIGVEGLAIVDTPDALLVAPLSRSQDVKRLVGVLEAQGKPQATMPARVHRPWGWYQTMDLGERFRVKRIQVAPGKKLSLQRHHHRAEHWVVVRGTAEVTRDDTVTLVRENESIYLPLGCVHRLANPGRIPVEIIEVQTGAYLEEDDIVRIEDDFGRQ